MANQQFCLRWNNYQSNLTQVFDQLLQSESFVDVTLSCEGNSVKAHRMVLSACSPYFQGLLSDAPCSHPVIILQGVKWPELKAVVEFMYKGEINICQEQLGSLLRVAESLKIRGLAEVDGDGGESAVLTSPAASPAARTLTNNFPEDRSISPILAATARKRRRLSGDDNSSRPCTPATPTSAPELMDNVLDLPPALGNRGGSAPLPGSPAGLSTLAAHLPGPMPPPAPMPHHLPHLPPLSPLLNMHHIHRHHTPDDFEIRPGIAEMIREEERRRRDAPDMAKLLESSHHWMGSPMADGGGPVFPSMFPDPPNNAKVSKIPGSASKGASATSKSISSSPPKQLQQQLPPPASPALTSSSAPPSVSSHPSAKRETSSPATKMLTHKISITSVVSSNNGTPNACSSVCSVLDNTVSITAARKPPSSSVGGSEAKAITITTSTITGTITSPVTALQHNRGHNNSSTVNSTRGASSIGRLAGAAGLEGPWENIQGAVSAPKSGASRWTQSDLVAALALVKAGTPIKPAAERCNIPVMTLWRRTRALGIVSSKVQCGFRYPAARRRSKTEPDHSTAVKCDNEDLVHFKIEPVNNYSPKVEPKLSMQPKMEPQDNSKEVLVQRAGPLREMSALHALCRVASRENSPRPLGRENSPLPLGRENSPKPIGRENSPRPLGRENSLKPLGRENSPRPLGRENSPRPFGRENSPRPLGRENSPRPLDRENSPRHLGRENSPKPLGIANSPRPFGRENSPRPLGRENSPRPLGRENSPRLLDREVILRPSGRECSPIILGRDNSPRPLGRDKMSLHLNKENSPRPELKEGTCRQQKEVECASPLASEKSECNPQPLSLKDDDNSNLDGPEKEGSPKPPLHAQVPTEGADRFRAWVDIVLEGAGRHHQQEIPQDLSTRTQRTSSPSPPSSQPPSSTSTTSTATAPQNPPPSPVHE